MENEPVLRVSFLITVDDYIHERLDFLTLGITRTERRVNFVFGLLLVLLGLCGALFFTSRPADWISWSLSVLCGLCVLFYYDKFFPVINAAQARKDYEGVKERLFAQAFTLSEDALEIASVRQKCRYPWDLFYRCVRTDHLVIFYLGIGSTRVLPLRMVAKEDQERLWPFLAGRLGSRYEEKTGSSS